MENIASAIARAQSGATTNAQQYIRNWKETLPPGSRWMPGDMGDPNCAHCRGLGYVKLALRVGHPDFGKMFTCDCAAEAHAGKIAAQLRAASSLEPDDLDLRYSGMIAAANLKPALKAVQDTIGRGWGWAYVWGRPGNGKTRLIKTAIAEAVKANQPAVYVLWPDMLSHIRQGIDAGDMDARIERWTSIGILAVDEFSRAKESEWTQEVAARIFSRRYEQAVYRRSVTLFASNFGPEVAAEWVEDRIYDGRFFCIEVQGASMRPAMR